MLINTLGVGFALYALGFLAELLVHVTKIGWHYKRPLSAFSLVVSGFSIGIFVAEAFSAATVLLALLMVYRAVNQLRLVESRMYEEYLRRATRISFVWLIVGQVGSILLWLLFTVIPSSFSGETALLLVACSLFLAGVFVLVATIKTIIKTRVKSVASISDKELPTLTVAIAARNENLILQECLEATLKSDYPKLEIIVLDDCSQDHTADIIKSFAHSGVRFVQGDEPNDTWLAKNAAYQKLLQESSGEVIFYMGVDVRVHPQTLRQLVSMFVTKRVIMMSILPKRTHSGLLAAFIQPMRYWTELALPEWILKHAPVLSTSWLADRKSLLRAGGFKSVTRAIVPEEHLSTAFSKKGEYAFVRTNDDINLTTHKNFHSQWLTALRTRYPQVHRRPEYAAIRVLLMLYFLVSPFVLLPLFLFAGDIVWQTTLLTLLSVCCLVASHLIVALVTNPAAAWLALINFPIVVVIDFISLHISMYRYEFGEVIWKGRNVTTPAMYVIPNLPAIDDNS